MKKIDIHSKDAEDKCCDDTHEHAWVCDTCECVFHEAGERPQDFPAIRCDDCFEESL